MKKMRHTEEQIAFALKQAETGTSVAEVIRRMGISEQTFYRWKKVYVGLAYDHAVRELREDSAPALIEAQASGRLLVVGAYYALSSGKVDFFDTEAGSAATKT